VRTDLYKLESVRLGRKRLELPLEPGHALDPVAGGAEQGIEQFSHAIGSPIRMEY
jgi:hypothetical protein